MMRRALIWIIAVCVLSGSFALPQRAALAEAPAPTVAQGGGTAPPALTLDEAVQEALTHNPQVLAAQQALAAAQQNVIVARAGLAPTVSANGSGGYGTSSATSFTPSGVAAPLQNVTGTGSVSVTANLPLFDSGRTQAAVETAQAGVASAQAALRQVQQDTSLSVATAFFNILQAERVTTVREAQLAQAQAQLALSQAQVRAGVAAQSDVIQALSQVAQAQVNLLAARSQIGASKASLQGALGADAAAPIEVHEPPAPTLAVTTTADAAMQAAVANRPEVAKAQSAVESAQAALDLARVNAGPQVTIGVGAAYTPYSTSPVLNNSTSYGLTGTVALPLFDAGKSGAQITGAQATLHSAQAQFEASRLTVRQDAYQAYLTAVQDAATITATQAAQAAAEEALRAAEGRYRAGVGTIVEVITAQAAAAQAEVNAVTAQYTYQAALATLQHAEGMPIQASARGGSQ